MKYEAGQERMSRALTWQFMTGVQSLLELGLQHLWKERLKAKNYQPSAIQRPNNASYCFCSNKASITKLKTWMVKIF